MCMDCKKNRMLAVAASLILLSLCMPLCAEDSRPKIAVVLEGGGAWGFAHVGVLKVIEELGIPVDIVVGTSMGSIVGALYASGYSPKEIESISCNADWLDLFRENNGKENLSYRDEVDRATYAASIKCDRKGLILNGGLISGNKILRFFDSLLVNIPSPCDFDNLPRRYRAVATDISTGERVVFSDGSLSDAMRASMSIPGVFAPFDYNGRYLVDGGLVENLPVDIAREMGADIIIAVDLRNLGQVDNEGYMRSPIQALTRSVDIALRSNIDRQIPGVDVLVTVGVDGFLATDFAKAQLITARGEEAARSKIDQLKAVKSRINGAKPLAFPYSSLPPISRVIVQGGTQREKENAYEYFSPLIGTVLSSESFSLPFQSIDRLNNFELVRVYRDSRQDDKPLVVNLVRKKTQVDELKLGILYTSTFGHSSYGNLAIVPALVVRGITTKDAELRISGEVLDTPSFSASLMQPFGNLFALTTGYSYEHESYSQFESKSVVVVYQTGMHVVRLSFDVMPFPGSDIYVGLEYDKIAIQYVPPDIAGTEVNSALLYETGLRIKKLDSAAFPMEGVSMSCDFKYSLPVIPSARYFQVFTSEGNTFLSLGTPFSVALLWKGGTDFSIGANDKNEAPWFYKPSLASRRLFPGPIGPQAETGSHVLGMGLELKKNINWNPRGVLFPMFAILQTSVGGAFHSSETIDWTSDIIQGELMAGIGIRINNAFGLELRFGGHSNKEYFLSPFIAFDLGSVGF